MKSLSLTGPGYDTLGKLESGEENENLEPKDRKYPVMLGRGLQLELRTNLFLGTREIGEKILNCLIETGDVFVPEFFDGGHLTSGKQVRFDPSDLSLPLKGWTSGRYSHGIIAERRNPLKITFTVTATDFVMFDHLRLRVSLDKDGVLDDERTKMFNDRVGLGKFLDVAKDLYAIIRPNTGYVRNDFQEQLCGDVLDDRGNVVGNNPPVGHARWALRGLFWANFFGPEYVEMFGREKLLGAPCYKVEELTDGGLIILISRSPFDAGGSEYQARKKTLYTYLGEDAFNGKILPRFRTDGRKKRDARPLIQTGGVRDDVFW
jgi:hypothetical protein